MSAELPKIISVSAAASGPTIAILGGVHGDEFEGVLAARQIISHADEFLVKGEIKFVAPAHPAAWNASTRESPIDGLNLARVFPGDANGKPTENVAHHITRNLITGSDLVIDLHSAGKNFDMTLLCGYQDSGNALSAESKKYAQIFDAPYTWRHGGPPSSGRSLSAAAELNIPSIYVEGRGGSQVRNSDLECYVSGVKRILHSLGMLACAPAPTLDSIRVEGDGNTDAGITAPVGGYFTTLVSVGDQVEVGDLLGEILDLNAMPVAQIRAPQAGVMMLVRRLAPVNVNDTLAIIAGIEQG
jgi:predicted deacylase